ncbi:MAG: F0F1 ATP synthase subunit B [Lachnospiraceae bacterium]|nr:F0F1 ATP synthase subunit B [Lachnospiraceae bacterium]
MTRLFNLDFQLLHDAVLLGISVFFLCLILSYLLFEPAKKLLAERKERIATDIATAAGDKEKAASLRAEYEAKLASAEKEVEQILGEARKKGLENQARIESEAKDEAARIIARANEEAELTKKRVEDEVKQQMIAVAALMAQKVVSANIDVTIQESLVDETLKEMGNATWQSR